jgi:ABC-2 type transport system permease protein
MRREGSPWQGLGTVMLKELADHFDSIRMLVLVLFLVAFAAVPLYIAVGQLQATQEPFPLLKLFNSGGLSVMEVLAFLLPAVAVGLGFDAISGEHNRRTLSRILAQPIYRDALLAGKFLAGIFVLAVNLLCLWLLVIGLGVLLLGVAPGSDDFARSLMFFIVALAYAGTWLGMALLFSVLFRSPTTAVLFAVGAWLFMTLLWPIISSFIAQLISPPDIRWLLLGDKDPATESWRRMLAWLSPYLLFEEAAGLILTPTTPSRGPIIDQYRQLGGMVIDAALPLRESLLMVWSEAVGLFAGAIGFFVAAYVAFQRQEVRA